MPYNLTNITDVNNTIEIIQNVNTGLMSGFLGILILIGITLVSFIAFYQATADSWKATAGAAFIAFGLSIFLRAMLLIPDSALIITLLGSAAAIAFVWRRN